MIIAVDFDGTIVEDKYPNIGKEIPFAIQTIKMLEAKGHRIILWTYRTKGKLDEAVDFCTQRGLTFYAVNKEFPEEDVSLENSRKIKADVFIDDRNVGGMPDWGVIYQTITNEILEENYKPKRKRFWPF